jgi:tripeptide aminopeptidase
MKKIIVLLIAAVALLGGNKLQAVKPPIKLVKPALTSAQAARKAELKARMLQKTAFYKPSMRNRYSNTKMVLAMPLRDSNAFVSLSSRKSTLTGVNNMASLCPESLPGYAAARAGKVMSNETLKMLARFLRYAKVESPSKDTNFFLIQDGQKELAQMIYDEIKEMQQRGGNVEVTLSEDHYVYARVKSTMKRDVPTIAFTSHLDVTPDENSRGIKPIIHRNYGGGIIELADGETIDPAKPEGAHLRDLVGKTIVTSDGTTLLGADCKSGVAVMMSLIEKLATEKKWQHGEVWFMFTQNEDIGKAAEKVDMELLGGKPDIFIDVDGGDYGKYSIANFTAEGRTYLLKGHKAHPAQAKEMRYGDALTAAGYFIGQFPAALNPANSEGMDGYVHCWSMEQLNDGEDVRLQFRLRYFDKADGVDYRKYFDEAEKRTAEAFGNVKIEKTYDQLQYDNVAYSMDRRTPGVVERAAKKAGVKMEPMSLRAGTTGAMMVAKGLPGSVCIYSGQQCEHTKKEWCCIEELVDILHTCIAMVDETKKL